MDRQIYDSVRRSGIVQGRHKHSTAVKYKRDRARGISCDCPFNSETPESSNHVDGRWKTVAVSCRAPHAMQLECRRDNGMKAGASDDRRDPCQQLKILNMFPEDSICT